MTADDIIATLGLEPHPEGGWYRQTWIADAPAGDRAAGTAIYFLLKENEASHWHRVDAAEIWHWYAGAPAELSTCVEGGTVERRILGTDLGAGQQPQLIVEPRHWQATRPLGGWVLVGCTVSPGFQFEGFDLAPPGWTPSSGQFSSP